MLTNQLRNVILKHISLKSVNFTVDGPIIIGFTPLSEEEISSQFKDCKLEIFQQLEHVSFPISLRDEFIAELQEHKQTILAMREEIASMNSPTNNLLLENKHALCESVLLFFEEGGITTGNTKIPIKLSSRELAVWVYSNYGILFKDVDVNSLLIHIQQNYRYYNERDHKYSDINLATLRKEFTVIKNSDRYTDLSPVDTMQEKMNSVLEKIKSRYPKEVSQGKAR